MLVYKKSKKKYIIGAILVLVIVLGIVLFFIFSSNDEVLDNNVDNQQLFDTTIVGDADIDPENIDIVQEEGVNVEADALMQVKDKSNGIDVSKWQGKINWEKVKNDNIDFAFIRIGYRGDNGIIYKDDNADYNIQQAQKAGVLVGVYFYSTAINEKEAQEEASWTKQAIEGYRISYPVVYDCEGFHNATSRMYHLTKEERTQNAIAFLKVIDKAGYDAMFYSSLQNIKNDWDISKIDSKYKIWIAQYSDVIYPQKEKPDYSGKCHAWQYTNRGSVNGISGNVDMVVCYFKNKESKPKNSKATPSTALAPLTDEEKLYTSVNEKVTAKDETNLRKSATTKSDIIATLKNGEVLTRIGVGTNGWSKLQYNGQTVYAITSYLTTDLSHKVDETPKQDIVSGQIFEPTSDQVTAKDEVNLRSLPTTDSEVIATLKSGDFLERSAIGDKGWSRLIYNGQTVYAITSYLSNEVVQKPNAPEVVFDGFDPVDEQVTAKDETNLRTKPSASDSEVVYTLKNGEYVKRIGIHSNGWSKLEYNGQIVYAISSYLTY